MDEKTTLRLTRKDNNDDLDAIDDGARSRTEKRRQDSPETITEITLMLATME